MNLYNSIYFSFFNILNMPKLDLNHELWIYAESTFQLSNLFFNILFEK